MPILEQAGAIFQVDGAAVSIEPSALVLPPKPAMPVEPLLCAAMLAFAMPCGGQVELVGQWPDWPECVMLWRLLLAMGLKAENSPGHLAADIKGRAAIASPASLPADLTMGLDEDFLPLALALAALGALGGEKMALPQIWPLKADTGDFMRAAGLEISGNGELQPAPSGNAAPIYNAPNAAFAMALALAAMGAKKAPGARLGNPGIMTTLWPGFWSFYNGLPEPGQKRREDAPPPKTRRRIRTAAEAILPDVKDDAQE